MRKGFSLIELLIYTGILAVISLLFIGILTTSTRVQVHEVALAEVGNQANFVLQTIQRLVRESSLIEEANGSDNDDTSNTEASYLKLRMQDPAKDPTCISLLDNGVIYVTQGPGSALERCKEIVEDDDRIRITTPKVTVPTMPPGLSLTLVSNAPARNVVDIELSMSYANPPPGGDYSKVLRTAIGRVSAATFDSDLLPEANDARDIGSPGTLWQDLFVSGTIEQGGNYNGLERGFMMIGGEIGETCGAICALHGLTCPAWGFYEFRQCTACQTNSNDYVMRRQGNCATAIGNGSSFPTVTGGLCLCQ